MIERPVRDPAHIKMDTHGTNLSGKNEPKLNMCHPPKCVTQLFHTPCPKGIPRKVALWRRGRQTGPKMLVKKKTVKSVVRQICIYKSYNLVIKKKKSSESDPRLRMSPRTCWK